MKFKELYGYAVKVGIDNDPRGAKVVQRDIDNTREKYNDAKGNAKEYFDLDSLVNPYSDTRMLWGDEGQEVRSLMVGIDLETPELLLADRLREKGRRVDLALTHHPSGRALARLSSVMALQVELLTEAGVNVATAEGLMEPRMKEVERSVSPTNHNRAVDSARLLGIPFMCAHTVADNCVATYLGNLFAQERPYRLKDLLDLLMKIPEYQRASRTFAGPCLFAGDPQRRAGKILLEMTGGTSGNKEVFASLEAAGVSTIVSMHQSEAHLKAAKEHHLNVVIAGHIASDTLGVNLLLDGIEKASGESLDVIEASGFVRVSRNA